MSLLLTYELCEDYCFVCESFYQKGLVICKTGSKQKTAGTHRNQDLFFLAEVRVTKIKLQAGIEQQD